jgi:hypothetical protein
MYSGVSDTWINISTEHSFLTTYKYLNFKKDYY